MAAVVLLKDKLNAHIAAMYAAGSLDEQFQMLRAEEDGSGFVGEIINLFIREARNTLDDIAALLEQAEVDFDRVNELVHKLKGSSSTVGAGKVRLMCEHFRQYFSTKSREGCLMALTIVRNEFYDIRNKFQTMLQLEEQIEAYTTNK